MPFGRKLSLPKSRFFATLVVVLLTTTFAETFRATAATTNGTVGGKATIVPNKGRGMPFHGTIASVDKAAKTITLEGKKQRTFQVTTETKIHLGKAAGSINSVTPGADVGGYARELPNGKLILVTLNVKTATEKPNGAKPPK